MIHLAALAVFSGLSLNLLLSFAIGSIGTAGKTFPGERRKLPLIQLCILFISVVFLWIIFSYVFPAKWRGFSEYFLYFPLSALTCTALEFLGELLFLRITGKTARIRKVFFSLAAYEGLVPASLLITLALAPNFTAAIVLALFFSLGNLTAMLLLYEIRRRSTLEKVPRFLQGTPIVIISMGLLSLIFIAAAGIFFKIL